MLSVRRGPGRILLLFFVPVTSASLFPGVLLDFIHFLPCIVLHMNESGRSSRVVGIGEIGGRHEGAAARSDLRGRVTDARRACDGARSYASDRCVLVHPAGSALRNMFDVDGNVL